MPNEACCREPQLLCDGRTWRYCGTLMIQSISIRRGHLLVAVLSAAVEMNQGCSLRKTHEQRCFEGESSDAMVVFELAPALTSCFAG